MKKSLIVFVLLAVSHLNAFADVCNSSQAYKGQLSVAESLQNSQLECEYRGKYSNADLTIHRPRCIGASPIVTLSVFDRTLNVSSIEFIRGIAEHTFNFEFYGVVGQIVCKVSR